MGRPSKNQHDEPTSERILLAAEEIFAARGYAAARLEDIASAVGIRRPSLLYHFASKEALYASVVERAFAEMSRAIQRGIAVEGGYERRLDATVDGLLAFEARRRPLLSVVLHVMLDPGSPAHLTVTGQLTPLVDGLEAFVKQSSKLPVCTPIRAIIMQLIMAHLSCAAMGSAGQQLWAGDTHIREIARTLLLPPKKVSNESDVEENDNEENDK